MVSSDPIWGHCPPRHGAPRLSSRAWRPLWLLVLVSCGPAETPVDLGPPAAELVMPDLSDLDMAQSLQSGLELVLAADLRGPWYGFTDTLERSSPGCPDLYVRDDDNMDSSMYWLDSCITPGGLTFEGEMGWDSLATRVVSDTDSSEQAYGERSLVGAAAVDDVNQRLWSFTGEGQDSFYQSTGPGYSRWTYSSTLTGTTAGSLPVEQGAPYLEGWREDLYLNYSGGDRVELSARGDLFLLQDRFDRFDSVSLDITLYGPLGAPPGACLLEPYGYIGLRDSSAYWYEVVFMPLEGDGGSNEGCDGCGTLFVRGVEQPDPVCLSFDWIWARLEPPDPAEFVFSVRL